jgi:5'-3' exonuclease
MLGVNILRSTLLGHILSSVDRFAPNKVFICFDCAGSNWRKEEYSLYKAQRKEAREKQDINWEEFYGFLTGFYEELKGSFPFISLKHNRLEADDIAAHLVRRFSCDTNIIITNDSDYLQLLKYKNIEIYNAISSKKMLCESPKRFLELKILTGDKSDNVPSIMPRVGPATAEKLLDSGELEEILAKPAAGGGPNETKRNYDRNKKLIDLDNTPEELIMSLENLIDDYQMVDTKHLTTYLREHTLRDLFDRISSIRRNLSRLVTAPDIPLGQPL